MLSSVITARLFQPPPPVWENTSDYILVPDPEHKRTAIYLSSPQERDEKGVLFWCHGNAETARETMVTGVVPRLATKLGLRLVVPEYPGYGPLSPGSTDLDETLRRVWLVFLSIANSYPGKILVAGFSLGGAIALSLASDPKLATHIAGLLLVSSFVSISAVAGHGYPLFSTLMWMAGVDSYLPIAEWCRTVPRTIPIVVLTGQKDQLVPPSQGDELAKLLGKPTRISVADAGHSAGLEHPAVLDQLAATLSP